jgi:predicted ATPase
MRLRFFGGFTIEANGVALVVRGRGQEALLFRLALDAGTRVSYRTLTEDIWPEDRPADPRASLQSLASRLRRELPEGALEAVPGGYRLNVSRSDVDIVGFQDTVERARRADPITGAALARAALALWTGEPWTPGDGFAWVLQDLRDDRAHALRLAAGETPEPAALDADPVPAPLTALVGRRGELDLIAAQLDSERLVTLLGPGGAGKTTLALETARRMPGSLFVELAPVAHGEIWNALDGAVGRRMRVAETTSVPATPRERTLQALGGREMLLVLDNCEHLAGAAAEVARDILLAVPGVRILATSREPLGVTGEAFVDLGPLSPGDGEELFARRVRAARGTPPHGPEVAESTRIVARLDGLPLAIELAAAKTRTLTLAEIDRGLDDRFALLKSAARVGDARHQTLRALIDWSWDMLSPGERVALTAIAVFPDGIGAEDLAAVASHLAVTTADVDALVDRSLLRRAEGRYRMLETVRDYGRDRLREDGELEEAHRRQAGVMAELVLAYDARTRGRDVRSAVAWFDANEDNLVAATRWCATSGDTRLGVSLTRGQLWVWLMRERTDEVQPALTAFAAAAADLESEPDVVVSAVALGVEVVRLERGEPTPESIEHLARRADEVLAAAARHRSELTLALPALLPGLIDILRDPERARGWSRSFVIRDVLDADAPEWTRGLVAVMRAAAAQNDGDLETLGDQSGRALETFRRIGDAWGTALASQMRAEWLILNGRLEEALEVADAAAPGLDGLATPWDIVQQRAQCVGVLMRMGRMDEARARLAEIIEFADAAGGDRVRMQVAYVQASVDIASGDADAALRALERIFEPAPAIPEQLTAWGHSKRAQAYVMARRLDEARDALRVALPVALRTGDQPIIADVVVSVAAWLAATGDPLAARRALATADALRGGADASDPFIARLHRRLDDDGAPEIPKDPDAPAPESLLALLL